MKNQRGSLTIWFVMMMPVLVLFMLLFINAFIMVDTKMQMQAAVDRGTYAAAAHLSHVMNQVADLNRDFNDEYWQKKNTLDPNSQDKASWIKDQVDELNNNHEALREKMTSLLENGYREADRIARSVVVKNLENLPQIIGSEYICGYGCPGEKMFEVVNEPNESGTGYLNQEVISPAEITGNSFDPESFASHSHLVHKYMIKSDSFVANAARLKVLYKAPFAHFFQDRAEVVFDSFAAAQPFGGSIKDFKHYKPGFIPVQLFEGE